jgi:arylformamidase
MKLFDISWPISSSMTEYKDRESVALNSLKHVAKDGVTESQICFHSHTGTHIDAPIHFVPGGKTIDQIDLQSLIGPCKVLDCSSIHEKIIADDLKKFDIVAGDRILLKTINSTLKPTDLFNSNFVYLDANGARYLADKKITTVGIDYLGIERNQPNHETHVTLFENDITLIEGLRLADVAPGTYQLYCLPLNIIGIDSAPARAIVISHK